MTGHAGQKQEVLQLLQLLNPDLCSGKERSAPRSGRQAQPSHRAPRRAWQDGEPTRALHSAVKHLQGRLVGQVRNPPG